MELSVDNSAVEVTSTTSDEGQQNQTVPVPVPVPARPAVPPVPAVTMQDERVTEKLPPTEENEAALSQEDLETAQIMENKIEEGKNDTALSQEDLETAQIMENKIEEGKNDTALSQEDLETAQIMENKIEEDKNDTALSQEDLETAQIMENKIDEDKNDNALLQEDLETAQIMKNNITEDKDSSPHSTGVKTPQSEPVEASLSTNKSDVTVVSTVSSRNSDPLFKHGNVLSSAAASDLIEYQWPAEGNGEYYMLQEQVSAYLGITSFKRKYPEISRRKLDAQEVNHLLLNMLLSEVQVTLGLTAVKTQDVCDIMMAEYPEKYQEYLDALDEKRRENIKSKHQQYSSPAVEKSQLPNYIRKAMKQVSEFSTRLNRQRREEYSVYYDMQTNVLQFPKHKTKKVNPRYTHPSLYPCSLIPGQFHEYYQKYNASELNYFPLNTAVYGPPAPSLPDNIETVDSDEEVQGVSSMETETADTNSCASEDNDPAAKDTAKKEVKEENQSNGEMDAKEAAEESKPDKEDPPEVKVGDEYLEKTLPIDLEDPDKPICGICLKDETCNKKGDPEDLISCSQCDNYGHPSCLDMSKELVSVIVTYNWQCLECKTCTYCNKPHHEDKMMFCDRCDRGYHTFCVGLRSLPSGLWMCPQCSRSDPDFAQKVAKGTPRKRKSNTTSDNGSQSSDAPVKQRRRRRTKKEMEEARERERLEKEERHKNRQQKREERKNKRQQRKEQSSAPASTTEKMDVDNSDDEVKNEAVDKEADTTKEEDAASQKEEVPVIKQEDDSAEKKEKDSTEATSAEKPTDDAVASETANPEE